MSHTKVRKHDIVEVHFLDHVEDGEGALPFVVWGKVDRVTKLSVRVVSWGHEDPDSKDAAECEPRTQKKFTIVRSAITKATVLKPT
jgi:hypothetical protein